MTRLPVKKTYKLFVGGAFPRSESGRTYEAEGQNVARASRKDVRDAVAAARKAFGPWAARTAYNRGQILYRAAEALESRAATMGVPRDELDAAVDVLLHYAGWTDKLHAVLGGVNPVAAANGNRSRRAGGLGGRAKRLLACWVSRGTRHPTRETKSNR